jgi:Autotransporter beta-domain
MNHQCLGAELTGQKNLRRSIMKFKVSVRNVLIAGAVLIVSSLSMNVNAACTISGGVISSSCSDGSPINWSSGNLTINQNVTVDGQVQATSFGGSHSFTNNGVMSIVGGTAIYTFGSTISSFINNGVLGTTTGSSNAIHLGGGSINVLTNNGSLLGYATDSVMNAGGTIGTFNNAQGVGNVNGSVVYGGALPTNYNIIINGPSNYGQLAGSSIAGVTDSTNFGIYSGSVITSKLYTGVLQGLTTSNVGASRVGTFGNFSWQLALESGSSNIWDLIFTGASTADTQQSLVNTSAALQNTFTLQNSVLANSFSYDCQVFGANNVCVSAGGRNTQVSAANGLNNNSALLIAAYRVMPSVRIGAYADQNLSVNNAGSTVNLGNNTPLIGLFGAWNERVDGTGTEVKVSAAYGQKNTTVTRQVVGTSEPGSGSSQLNSQGAQVTAKYGFAVMPEVIVSPYMGMRYTQNNMGGYTEGASSSVTAPLTYSALNTNATTALAGVGASYRGIPQTTLFASAGVETDANTANGTYSATGVSGLTPINFNANPVKTRPTAALGAYYDIVKNQRVGITGIYRQEAYQAVSTTTVMATYTVGL